MCSSHLKDVKDVASFKSGLRNSYKMWIIQTIPIIFLSAVLPSNISLKEAYTSYDCNYFNTNPLHLKEKHKMWQRSRAELELSSFHLCFLAVMQNMNPTEGLSYNVLQWVELHFMPKSKLKNMNSPTDRHFTESRAWWPWPKFYDCSFLNVGNSQLQRNWERCCVLDYCIISWKTMIND